MLQCNIDAGTVCKRALAAAIVPIWIVARAEQAAIDPAGGA
jgi:hypothetical protein